jgi:hypothetical protein
LLIFIYVFRDTIIFYENDFDPDMPDVLSMAKKALSENKSPQRRESPPPSQQRARLESQSSREELSKTPQGNHQAGPSQREQIGASPPVRVQTPKMVCK